MVKGDKEFSQVFLGTPEGPLELSQSVLKSEKGVWVGVKSATLSALL